MSYLKFVGFNDHCRKYGWILIHGENKIHYLTSETETTPDQQPNTVKCQYLNTWVKIPDIDKILKEEPYIITNAFQIFAGKN